MPSKTGRIKLDVTAARGLRPDKAASLLPGGWWLWCLAGLGLGLAAWAGGRGYLRSELTQQLSSQASEQEALASIDALMRLDGASAVDVSRALAHPNFVVAHAAYRALNQQLDAWSELAATKRTQRMAELIDQLELVPGDCDEDHRILITGLASRLYADALSSQEATAGALLDRCRKLMDRKAVAQSSSTIENFDSSLTGQESSPAPVASSLSDGGEASASSDSPPMPLPPIEATGSQTSLRFSDSSDASPASSPDARSPSPATIEMPRLTSTASERTEFDTARVHLAGVSSRQATLVDRPAAMTLSDGDLPQSLSEEGPLRAAPPFDAAGVGSDISAVGSDPQAAVHPAGVAIRPEEAEAIAGIDKLSIDRVVRLLSSPEPRVAQAAALALRGKGMSDDKLDLAMQLAVGSSAQRLELIQSFGQRSDLDPRPWLLWMAADGDEAVREQAVGMLAPLLDQEVRRQLRQLLSQERDERVAQTIRRVLVR